MTALSADAPFWNRIAESYAKKPVANPGAFERKIAITRELLPEGGAVLDVGCGTGSLALRLADRAGRVGGLDASREMVRIAREKARAARAANVEFHVGTLDDALPFPPQSFDLVCAYSVLHLVRDLPRTLAALRNLLRPGGALVTSTVCLGDSWVPFRPILGVMRRLGKAPYVAILRRDAFTGALGDAGFSDIELCDVGADSTVAFTIARRHS